MEPKTEKLPIPAVALGEGPHWDIVTQSLYFVDIAGSQLLRYDSKANKAFSVKLDIPSAAFIIPVKDSKEQFVVGSLIKLYLIKWDGTSDKVESVELLYELTNDSEGNRINDGKCDPTGRLWFDTPCRDQGQDEIVLNYLLDANRKMVVTVEKVPTPPVVIGEAPYWDADCLSLYVVDVMGAAIIRYDLALHQAFRTKLETKDDLHGVSLEDALSICGFGRYQRCIAIVGGLCWLSCALQNSLSAYILPSIKCEMHVSSSMLGLFNAVFLAGGLSSSILWGVLTDSIGRRPVLVYGMAIDSCLTILSSFSQNFYLLLVARFLSGFIVGGPAAIAPAFVGEFQPGHKRQQVICYLGFFWTFSWVILPGIAWLIIPLNIQLHWNGFSYSSWRFIILLVSIPSFVSTILLCRYPESPRFLLAQGRAPETLDVLSRIWEVNKRKKANTFPVKSLDYVSNTSAVKEEPKSIWRPVKMMLTQWQSLLAMPVLPITLLGCFLFFSNMFGYYGLGLWLPELVNRLEAHYSVSNRTVTLCDLTAKVETLELKDDDCVIPSTVFVQSLIIGSMGLVGNGLSGLLSSKFPRPVMPVILMSSAGASVLSLYLVRSSFQNLLVSTIFQFCIGTYNMVYNALVVDMFLADISGIAICMCVMSGRLGAMLLNLVLLDVSCFIPILLCAVVILLGAFFSAFIPKVPYCEKIKEQEKTVITA